MKHILFIGLVLILSFSCLHGQAVQEMDRAGIESITGKSNDTTYVVNFWATWCSPCVKEIGYFEELHREFSHSKLKVILVSLDFPNQVEKRVLPFLKKKNITASVAIMTDLDYNAWIDIVDPSWSGAIPATLIYNDKERVFLEKELSRSDLYNNVHQILN